MATGRRRPAAKPPPRGQGELLQLQKLCEDLQRENERLQEELATFQKQAVSQSSRIGVLHDISLAVLTGGSTEELSNSMLKVIARELEVNSCSLMLKHDDTLKVEAATGLPDRIAFSAKRRKGEGISGLVMETGKSIWANDIQEQPTLAGRSIDGTRYETSSFISVPIIVKGRLIGVLNAADKKDRRSFTESDVPFVEEVARLVGIVLENARVQEKNRQLAITDELTGLYNYRHFQGALAVEIERARRYSRRGLSLIMADLDHFKRYNDTYGHQEGDHVLQRVAKVLQQEARRVDVVSRYGGEEFAIILPEIEKGDAQVYAERARKKIETLHEHDPQLRQPITISSGIAVFPADGGDQTQLIRSADQALYNAKSAGRNRTSLFHKGTEPLL